MRGATGPSSGKLGVAVCPLVLLALLLGAAWPAYAAVDRPSPTGTVTPALVVQGLSPGALAGRSVALADFDGDGRADLVVGAPSDSTGGLLAGQVLIYFGGTPRTTPDRTINGSRGERFGWSVARAGDVDLNGVDDLIVGAPFNDTAAADAGAAYVFLGWRNRTALPTAAHRANVTLTGSLAGEAFGYAVAAAGDANLDAFDDIAVGAPLAGTGRAFVFYGGSPMDEAADKTFRGGATGDGFGSSIAGEANVDGDASPDLVVGAPMADAGRGSADVILNVRRTNPRTIGLTGPGATDRFGSSVAILNFNGDGFSDVAVGAPGTGSGRAFLYYGAATSGRFDDTSDRTFSTGMLGDQFGWSVASGDPRSDGIDDLLVGAPFNDTAGADAGRAYVFYGNASADTLADVTADGAAAEDQFGFSLASGTNARADTNADRGADFAVGTPLNGADNRGAAYLFLGFRVIVPANPTVFGYVLDNATAPKRGLADALMTIESATVSRATKTLANGSYGIATPVSVPPGTYWINASKANYFSASRQAALSFDTRTNVSFNLTRLPVVHGTIFDGNTTGFPSPSGHAPLSGATVQALNGTGAVLGTATTDASGTYFLRLPQTGTVTIRASKAESFDNATTFPIREDQNLTKDLTLDRKPILLVRATDGGSSPPGAALSGVAVTVSIGGSLAATGTTDAAGNARLVVNGRGAAFVNGTRAGYVPTSRTATLAQNTTTRLTLRLDRLPTLSGSVRNALTGSALRNAAVEALHRTNGTLAASGTTNNQGAYALGALSPGRYDVRVSAAGFFRTTQADFALQANQAAVLDFALVPDSIAPTSSVTSPAPGTPMARVDFPVAATASDPNGNELARVELWYSYNNTAFVMWAADTTAPYSFSFNASRAKGDGRYGFYTIAVDYADNREAAPTANDTWVVVDAKLPTSSLQALAAFTTTASFRVAGTASDDSGVREVQLWYRKDAGAYALSATDTSAPYEWTFDASTSGDGVYEFYTVAVDSFGLVEAPPSGPDTRTRVDTTPPAVALTAPVDQAVLNATDVTARATVTDAGSRVDSVDYRVDGGAFTSIASDLSVTSYEATVSLSLPDGAHTISIRASDLAGLQTTTTVSVVVDTADPSLAISAPSAGAFLNTNTVRVSWAASDGGSGLAAIVVRVDAGPSVTLPGTATEYTTSALTDGSHSVSVEARDRAGNAAAQTGSFIVDTSVPAVTIQAPTVGQLFRSGTVTTSWTATDAGSGLAAVEARVDGGAWQATSGTSATFSSLADGTHTIDVRATDRAANAAVASVTFRVDTTLPSLSITAPEEGETIQAMDVTVSWSASDSGSGIDHYEVRRDGGTFVSTGTAQSLTFRGVSEGEHTVTVRAIDLAGNIQEQTVSFEVRPPGGLEPLTTAIIAGSAAAIILGVALVAWYVRRRSRAPKSPEEPPKAP